MIGMNILCTRNITSLQFACYEIYDNLCALYL